MVATAMVQGSTIKQNAADAPWFGFGPGLWFSERQIAAWQ